MRVPLVAVIGTAFVCAACSSAPAGGSRANPSSGVGTEVVCASSSHADLAADREILQRRASDIATAAKAQIDGDTVIVTLPGPGDYQVTSLCSAELLNFRPLVMPADPVTHSLAPSASSNMRNSGSQSTATAPPASSDPLTGLPFPIPTNDIEFNNLSTTQQQELQTAMSSFDCTAAPDEPDVARKPFLACDNGKTYGAQLAYLLGPVIVAGHEIKTAAARAPNVSQGGTEWTVSLSLKPSGQTRWAQYTGAHSLGSATATGGSVTQCGASSTPCGDYVGFVLDGEVISAPVNQEAINSGKTQISGDFTSQTAKRLAAELASGSLPVDLRLTSVRRVK
jgi:preprotein translocase subunit SecD